MKNRLDQLKNFSTVVCDTGDIELIKLYSPTDATTNPSLILKAINDVKYKHLLDDAVSFGKGCNLNEVETKSIIMDKILVNFGREILKVIPGRVSTEIDARLSFNKDLTISRALRLISMYEKEGISKDRVLIKLASTWEGIQAARVLEQKNIKCNLTLLFSLVQAIAAAEAGVTLISPFVGRILDWYKKNTNTSDYKIEEDPGVISVVQIYAYYKKFGIKTQIMAASFRNIEQVLALSGCDLLTISPSLLKELQSSNENVYKSLTPAISDNLNLRKLELKESGFRYLLNDNAMASEKLSEGIRLFSADIISLENIVKREMATF